MEEYASNSINAKKIKEEKKDLETVVKSPVKRKKRGLIKQIIDLFVVEEQESVKDYIIFDVVVPALKDLIWNVSTGSLELKLWGERGKSTKSSSSTASKISYRSFYDGNKNQRESTPRIGYHFDEIVFDTQSDARDVLSRLDEIISVYSVASVADFYDIAGIDGNHTDNKYGWADLSNTDIVRTREGYVIKFPRALPITSI